jgi:PKD repeat protein
VFGRAGNYDVTLTVTTPAGTSSRTIKNMITIDGETGIDSAKVGEVGLEKNIIAKGEVVKVIASGISEDAVLTIHGTKGQLLHKAEIPAKSECVEIALPDFPLGVYIYVIKTATQKFFGQFMVK